MQYKDCLMFVAKCLTLDSYPRRTKEIKDAINNKTIDWEDVVRLSSGQFVLPAVYLQLKRNGLLPELPSDLTEYLKEITDLNRERNLAILDQAKGITSILNAHNISPIFLKGVAHVLGGFYIDIAERMIGDIDLLVAEDKMIKASEVLINKGYKPLVEYTPNMFRRLKHYPRLQNFNYPAAVEIHKEVMNPPHQKIFRGFELIKDKQQVTEWQGEAFIPSVRHLIIHNILNAQINDEGNYYGKFYLRQIYDLLLLAQRENPLTEADQSGIFFSHVNKNLAVANLLLDNPDCLPYVPNMKAGMFRTRIKSYVTYPGWGNFIQLILYTLQRMRNYARAIIRSIYNKRERKSVIDRLSNPNWYTLQFQGFRQYFR